MTHKQERSWE